jgi:hypothetical protein
MKNLFAILLFISSFAEAQRTADSIAISRGAVCIFYDFDGQFVPSTSGWGININASPSAANANTATKDSITNFGREAFSPFNVIVTQDSTLYHLAAQGKRARIIFTSTCTWDGCINGGTTVVNSMTLPNETPSFVFDNVGVTTTKASAAVHETGHQFGLGHQGISGGSELNTGYGSGQTSFAPIMGNSYSKNMQVWWNGNLGNIAPPYNQYDITDLATGYRSASLAYNGTAAGFKTPDFGVTAQSARILLNGVAKYGLLSSLDSDYFQINIPSTQTVTIAIQPWSFGANTKPQLYVGFDLYQSDGLLVTSSSNTTVINATTVITVKRGTYILKVRPNRSSSNNPTGYGFMGHYTITFTY